jgi:hypothetical protein
MISSSPPLPTRGSTVTATLSGAGPGRGGEFDVVRMIESGDEVVVTYESNASGGGRGRNTEVFTFDDDDKITRTEVYFGWNLE